MYRLKAVYGKASHDEWQITHSDNLSGTQYCWKCAIAEENHWRVKTYKELVGAVSFLGVMNKRLKLFYRGQRTSVIPVPSIFRDRAVAGNPPIGTDNWKDFWNELERIGAKLYEMLLPKKDNPLSAPRWRGLRDVREARWAVIQHYGLWPTPLIDLTNNLRIAASFAMDHLPATSGVERVGYVFVFGMPAETGSITFDLDQQIVLARLAAVCPPAAQRPHFQDGFLAGRFPMDVSSSFDGKRLARLVDKSTPAYRTVAVLELVDAGRFWSDDPAFPIVPRPAVYPEGDLLEEALADCNKEYWAKAQEYGANPGDALKCTPRDRTTCAWCTGDDDGRDEDSPRAGFTTEVVRSSAVGSHGLKSG